MRRRQEGFVKFKLVFLLWCSLFLWSILYYGHHRTTSIVLCILLPILCILLINRFIISVGRFLLWRNLLVVACIILKLGLIIHLRISDYCSSTLRHLLFDCIIDHGLFERTLSCSFRAHFNMPSPHSFKFILSQLVLLLIIGLKMQFVNALRGNTHHWLVISFSYVLILFL